MTDHATQGRVVVVGSANADLLVRSPATPRPGETLLGSSIRVTPGGKGANQAVAASRLGADVAFVGAVGDDQFAVTALEGLQDAGVNLTGLERVAGPSGVAVVTVTDDGENSIIVIAGANAHVAADAVARHRDVIGSGDVVVLQGEIPRSGLEEAARHTTGRLLVNLAPVIDVDAAVLRSADPLVLNEHEATLVAEVLGGATPGAAASSGEDLALVEALRAGGIRSLVLTLGARGAIVAAASGEVTRVPSPTVEAVDTTGAGDAFVGALAGALARGEDLETATHLAVRVGAYAVRGHGAQPSYPHAGDELPQVPA